MRATRNIGGFLIPDRDPQYPVSYVLDGQQRLSAIYALFCRDRRIASDDDRYKVDAKLFNIYFDLDEIRFLTEGDINSSHTNLRLSSLLNNRDFNKQIRDYPEDLGDIAVDLPVKIPKL